jgi:hypothetical protein
MTIIWFWLGLRVPIAVVDTERGTQKCVDKIEARKNVPV